MQKQVVLQILMGKSSTSRGGRRWHVAEAVHGVVVQDLNCILQRLL